MWTSTMVQREVPFCAKHFLKFAEEAFWKKTREETERQMQLSAVSARTFLEGDSQTEPSTPVPSPARVQPRRQAKRKKANSAGGKAKKQKTISNSYVTIPAPSPSLCSTDATTLPAWEEVEKDLRALLLSKQDCYMRSPGCVFGSKPWVCGRCDEEYGLSRLQLTFPITEEMLRAPLPKMNGKRHGPSSASCLDWNDVAVPEERMFEFCGMSFVVDNCHGTMVLMV